MSESKKCREPWCDNPGVEWVQVDRRHQQWCCADCAETWRKASDYYTEEMES